MKRHIRMDHLCRYFKIRDPFYFNITESVKSKIGFISFCAACGNNGVFGLGRTQIFCIDPAFFIQHFSVSDGNDCSGGRGEGDLFSAGNIFTEINDAVSDPQR